MRAQRAARLLGVLWIAAGAGACTISGSMQQTNPPLRFTADDSPIQVVTTQIGGKNVFIPSTLVVTAGRSHTLSIYNTTDSPHGFAIPGLGVETILPPGEEHRVVLPPAESEQVLRINCHLHPAHRTATLVVLPGS